jgi:hypothetical protein
MPQNMEHCPNGQDIRNDEGCPNGQDITSFTSSLHLEAIAAGAPPQSAVAGGDGADERPEWSTPVLIEVFGKERDRLLKNLAKIPIEKSTTSEIPKRKQTPEEFKAWMTEHGFDLSLSRRQR